MINAPLQEAIVERTRQIDNLLFKLGGNGRNMQDRAKSLRSRLGGNDVRRLDRIIAVNRRMVYDNRLRIERDHERFIAACDGLIARLEGMLTRETEAARRSPTSSTAPANRTFSTTAACVSWVVVAALYSIAIDHVGWTRGTIQTFAGIPFVIALLIVMFLTTQFVGRRR